MPVIRSAYKAEGKELAILVEVDKEPEAPGVYGDVRDVKDVVKAARDVFGDGLALARDCAARVVAGIGAMGPEIRPNEFQVELAIKLNTQVGAFLTKVGGEAQLMVTMKWIRGK